MINAWNDIFVNMKKSLSSSARTRLGAKIKELREVNGLTKTQVYDIVKINQSVLTRLENDKEDFNPSLATIVALAKCFHMKAWKLLKEINL